jgi:hypothetical protein
MIRLTIAFLLMRLGACAADAVVNDFVIDSSRPYAYLAFDHIGVRKPTQASDSTAGLWLRVVNNSRVPLLVATFGLTTGDPGAGVYYEVIPDVTAKVYAGEVLAGTDTDCAGGPVGMPNGLPGAELQSATVIAPGHDLLFGVPRNSIGPGWFMRVKCTLKVGSNRSGPGPYTELDFFENQIPSDAPGGHHQGNAASVHSPERLANHEAKHSVERQ